MTHVSPTTRSMRIQNAMTRAVSRSPILPVVQRQDSLTDQLYDLWVVSTKLGMYDAADWLWKNADLKEDV